MTGPELTPRYLQRIVKLCGWGAVMGCIFATWVIILAVVQGSLDVRIRGREEVNVLVAAAVYIGGGGIAGAIVGLLYPLARWRLGAVLVGITALTPFALGIGLSLTGLGQSWEAANTFAAAVVAIGLGGGLGMIYREIFMGDTDSSNHSTTDGNGSS
jgi:hypothetical protein